MLKPFITALFGLTLSAGTAVAQCTSFPNMLASGMVANASQVMQNFNCTVLNGGGTLTNGALAGNTTLAGGGLLNSSGQLEGIASGVI